MRMPKGAMTSGGGGQGVRNKTHDGWLARSYSYILKGSCFKGQLFIPLVNQPTLVIVGSGTTRLKHISSSSRMIFPRFGVKKSPKKHWSHHVEMRNPRMQSWNSWRFFQGSFSPTKLFHNPGGDDCILGGALHFQHQGSSTEEGPMKNLPKMPRRLEVLRNIAAESLVLSCGCFHKLKLWKWVKLSKSSFWFLKNLSETYSSIFPTYPRWKLQHI